MIKKFMYSKNGRGVRVTYQGDHYLVEETMNGEVIFKTTVLDWKDPVAKSFIKTII